MSTIDNAMKRLADIKLEKQALQEEVFKEAIKSFFANNPTIKAIRWQQYVPYFNDGEACEFNVYDIDAAFDRPLGEWDAGEIISSYESPDGVTDAENMAISTLGSLLSDELSDYLKDFFGEHAVITITSDGEVTNESYEDHD